VAPEWRSRGVEIVRPIEGLRFGEQLGWYGDQLGLARLSSAGPRVVHPVPSLPADLVGDGRGLGRRISQLFADGAFDLSGRVSAPVAGWAGMPEVRAATRLHVLGANEATLRRFLTFNAAMDRARDADRLADNAVRLFEHHAWAFDPDEITRRPLTDLVDALRASGVSQRHVPDAFGWRVMAETLSDTASSGPVGQVIAQGSGDALELLAALDAESAAGTPRFPLLRGPKIGPLWVRLMAYPGGARINSLGQLPVAVDVQVRKVTEYLGVTDTGGLSLDDVRAAIQETWARDVERNGVIGPAQLGATTGALDPALWFYAKWGCTFCERAGTKLPISPVCDSCRFPERGRTREPESPGSLKTSTAIDAGQEDWAD
jgi:hypothetical protein